MCDADHHHDPIPRDRPVKMHLTHCDHGEPFACLSDLIQWLDRMTLRDQPEMAAFRDYVVENLTHMSLDYDLGR